MIDKVHRNALQPDYQLHWYRIGRILGQGGFGIAYLAHDTNLDQQVAIKEYLPIELTVREGDFSVHPVSEDRGENFRWGLDRFIREARTLARFDHPNIVRVLSVFEVNNTAYIVMRYEHGKSLQEMLPKRGTLEEQLLLNILFPILGGLAKVHAQGFIHRDIKPANLFIREDQSPVLLDFGSARQALGQETKTLTTLVSPGYAPFEQYYSKSDRQGPWTDIYGLGATMYRCVVGAPPMDALDRSEGLLRQHSDPLIRAAEVGDSRYSRRFLQAIDHAIAFHEEARPQSVAEWADEFGLPDPPTEPVSLAPPAGVINGATAAPGSPAEQPTMAKPDVDYPPATAEVAETAETRKGPDPQPDNARSRKVAAIAAAVVLAVAIGWALNAGRRGLDQVADDTETPAPSTVEESAAISIPDLLSGAQADLEAGRIASPAGNNALDKIDRVLEQDPGNRDARETLEHLAAEFTAQRVADLVERADQDFAADRLSTPAGNNALARYRQALELDPDSEAAKDGLRNLVKRYVTLGKAAVKNKDLERAKGYLRHALEIAPNNKALKRYQRRLEKAKARRN